MQLTTLGLNRAKSWFQVHGVDAGGKVVLRRKLKRSDVVNFFRLLVPCLVSIEACATAHYWARELIALGHDVRMPSVVSISDSPAANSAGNTMMAEVETPRPA